MKSILAFLLATFAIAAQSSVLYEYTGKNFNRFSASSSELDVYPDKTVFSSSDHLSFSFVLSEALPAHSNIFFNVQLEVMLNNNTGPSPISVESWKAKAGPLTLTTASFLQASISTGEFGEVNNWNFELYNYLPDPFQEGTVFRGVDTLMRSYHQDWPSSSMDVAVSCLGEAQCLSAFGYPIGSVNMPGVWSISITPVPEPATLSIVGLALAGLAYNRRFVNKKRSIQSDRRK